MTASLTTPTEWVFVIATGPYSMPDSSTHWLPVISPAPFSEKIPAKHVESCWPRGSTAVTPVRTAAAPSPQTSVSWPTSTPVTSVIALSGPGRPSKGTPSARARGRCCWEPLLLATGVGQGAAASLCQCWVTRLSRQVRRRNRSAIGGAEQRL